MQFHANYERYLFSDPVFESIFSDNIYCYVVDNLLFFAESGGHSL